MAARGRPNKTAKPAKKTTAPKKATTKEKAKGAAKYFTLLGGDASAKKKAVGGKRKVTALQRLKKAYERRARRQISMGALGLARKTLRKKRMVI